jgi:tRNA-dihydrouridine synthase B
MLGHVRRLHEFYGEHMGLRIARKHIGWYLQGRPGGAHARAELVRVEAASAQLELLEAYFAAAAA